MDFPYRVTVIVPVYNQEPFLEKSVTSLLNQTMPNKEYEILLIDDGSTDNSSAMCDAYAAKHDNVFVVHKENGGLSSARNCGIKHARGKYIMYLDGDDSLREDTLAEVCSFFDEHYDEVDLVTYPILYVREGVESQSHYRYFALTASGVYDLTEGRGVYAGVTTINVCVKNLGEDNVLFSSVREFRHEDQKYSTDILLKKLKLGFCNNGAYLYEQQASGLVSTTFQAYYLFEPTMKFWEDEFSRYSGEVPKYLQALYVSDLGWKLYSNILFPYQYQGEEYSAACSRIYKLLDRCDSELIAKHPALDQFQSAYFLQCKSTGNVKCICGVRVAALIEDDKLLYSSNNGIEIILLRTTLSEGSMSLIGFLKSPCFQFVEEPPVLRSYAVQDDVRIDSIVPLRPSSWSYYKTKEKICDFWTFEYTLSVHESGSLEFVVDFNGETIPTNYYFMPRSIFSYEHPKRFDVSKDGFLYSFNGFSKFTIKKASSFELRRVEASNEREFFSMPKTVVARWAAKSYSAKRRRVWLYHDCHGVEKNNAYFQFKHDIKMDDGIERYYVVNDPLESKRHLFSQGEFKNVIQFRSFKHKLLFLSAEMIITAYVEQANWSPFDGVGLPFFTDMFSAKIVYLQHGVLHAHTPWKYSKDRLLIDKEVVSTPFETQNLCENYCFNSDDLIKAGMPRYDYIDSTASPKKKILVALSWRKFLVRQKPDGQWMGVPTIFENSDFYKSLSAFLNSEQLMTLLEKYNYTLELKLHPILAELYKDYFTFSSPNISLAPDSVNDEDYSIFITDFSSYRFDYVYLKRAIMYFFPDKEMFDAGMCDYRETDLPLDGMFGDLATTPDEAIEILSDILERGAVPKEEYKKQMDDFFYYYDNHQCDRIYDSLINA